MNSIKKNSWSKFSIGGIGLLVGNAIVFKFHRFKINQICLAKFGKKIILWEFDLKINLKYVIFLNNI